MSAMTAPPEIIDSIRLAYRLAKSAEDTRNRLSSGVTAFVRTYVSGWEPNASKAERKETAAAAKKIVKYVLRAQRPTDDKGRPVVPFPEVLDKVELTPGDEEMLRQVESMIVDVAGPWWRFEIERHLNRQKAEAFCVDLSAWPQMPARGHGFSPWGLVSIIGEAGDIGHYSGCRKLYKRLGLAPDECYPLGEKRTGRKIPRATRGRIMGIITEPLLRQQWRAEKDGVAGHPIGPFGAVYADAKARHLAAGKSKGHAEKTARRAMVKALLHDVHRAWHDKPPEYAAIVEAAA